MVIYDLSCFCRNLMTLVIALALLINGCDFPGAELEIILPCPLLLIASTVPYSITLLKADVACWGNSTSWVKSPQAGTVELCVCPIRNLAQVNTSLILLFSRKWRPRYTWQPEQGTRKWPNICSRTKPKSTPRPRWVQEAAAVLDMSLKVQEELRGRAAGLVGPRFPAPPMWLHPTLRFCFAGLLRGPDVCWHQSCFFRKTKGQ